MSFFWLAPLAVLGLMAYFVAPHRGALWFSDDGFFLLRSWTLAHGFGFDQAMIPQDPCYLVNAGLMRLGLSGLLAFRQAGACLTFISAAAFFTALDPRRSGSPLPPLAVCASLLLSLTSVATPTSLSVAFFMLGGAAYFLAVDAEGPSGPWLPLLGGLCFALAGFMHAVVAVAMGALCLLLLWAHPPWRRSLFLPAFVVASALLWGFYLHAVGLGNFLAPPAAHDGSSQYLLSRLRLLLRHAGEALTAFALASILFWPAGKKRFAAAEAMLGLLVTLFYGWTLLNFSRGLPPPSPWLKPPWAVFFFTDAGQYIARIPGAALYLLYFASFRWLAGRWQEAGPGNAFQRVDAALRADAGGRKVLVAVAGLGLINGALSVGSLSEVMQNFAFTGGCLVGLALVLDGEGFSPGLPRASRMAPFLWLGLLLLFTLSYNHPDKSSLFLPGRQPLPEGAARGILVEPRYQKAVASLQAAYEASHAKGLPLFALEHVPMAYLLLQQPLPSHCGLIRPAYFYDEACLRGQLGSSQGWCVLDTTGEETRGWIAHRGSDPRAALRAWVAAHSDTVTQVPAPSADLDELTLFVRQPRP